MLAGTIIILGKTGAYLGFGMKRGTIVLAKKPRQLLAIFSIINIFRHCNIGLAIFYRLMDQGTACFFNGMRTYYRHRCARATPNAGYSLYSNIVIGLRPAGSGFELSVKDDGVGIGEGAERSGGLGLAIMRYRAESIGAQLEIGGKHGEGTTVLCRVPAHAKHNAND